jgi:methionyl-tRNA formyltransferase
MVKILFLGQKPLGESCFDILLQTKDMEIIGVVSNVDSQKGWWGTNNIYKKCISEKIPFLNNNKKSEEEIVKLIEEEKPDYLLSVQHPWILSSNILKAINYQAFNLHMAKLPDYKGWNSFSHAILNEEKEYGVTLHWIVEEVDEGAIAFEKLFLINNDDTAKSLYLKAHEESLCLMRLLCSALSRKHEIPKKPMPHSGSFYGKDSLQNIKNINSADIKSLKEIQKIARACYFPPFEPAYFMCGNNKFQLILKND